MPRVQRFDYKLGTMRKPDNIIVYPHKAGEREYLFQGDRCIGRVNRDTLEGKLYVGRSPYAPMLALAKPYTFTREFVGMVVEFAPGSGDYIGGGVTVA